jgi:hypothetical protein
MATKGGVICREGRQQQQQPAIAYLIKRMRHVSHRFRLSLFPLGNTVTTLLQAVLQAEAHLSVIMNPFKFVVAAAAAVLLAGTQSVAAKPFVGSLGGLNTLLDFRVEVDAANACDAAAYSDGSVTKGLASVFPSLLKKIEKEMGHGTIHPTPIKCKRSVSRRPHSSTVTLTPMSKVFSKAFVKMAW